MGTGYRLQLIQDARGIWHDAVGGIWHPIPRASAVGRALLRCQACGLGAARWINVDDSARYRLLCARHIRIIRSLDKGGLDNA